MNRPWRRRLLRWFGILLILYACLLLVLVALEGRLIYRATLASTSWQEPGDLNAEDVTFTSVDGTKIHAWWLPGKGAPGAVLFCHGQQGNLSHRRRVLRRLQELGMPVLIFDYPGFGHSEGSPTEQGCYDAADAAFEWLVGEKTVPAEQIVVLGKSLGGGIATDLASRRNCRALVLIMTFTSTPDVAERLLPFVPVRLLMRTRFDNLGKIGHVSCPVYLAHGAEDWKIPADHSVILFAAVQGPRRLFLMPGIGHGWPCLTDECLEDLSHFLRDPACTSN